MQGLTKLLLAHCQATDVLAAIGVECLTWCPNRCQSGAYQATGRGLKTNQTLVIQVTERYQNSLVRCADFGLLGEWKDQELL